MTLSWDVLSTMTPSDYTRFRHVLGPSSGFQSDQFRTVEFMLGLKDASHPEISKRPTRGARRDGRGTDRTEHLGRYDHRAGARGNRCAVGPTRIATGHSRTSFRPRSKPGFLQVYRDTERYWELYQLAEKLVDLDDAMATWRHKHVLTVERIIGGKRGTGGTAGVSYLSSTVTKRAFPELWSLRTQL